MSASLVNYIFKISKIIRIYKFIIYESIQFNNSTYVIWYVYIIHGRFYIFFEFIEVKKLKQQFCI